MTDLPPAKAPRTMPVWMRVAVVLVGLVAMASGINQIYHAYGDRSAPACTSGSDRDSPCVDAGRDTKIHAQAVAVSTAADDFAKLTAGSGKSGQVPRQTDPTAGALLDIVFQPAPVPAGTALPFAGLDDVSKWLLATTKAGMVYALAGTGYDSLAALPQDVDMAALNAKVEQNAVAYQPELGRFYGAELALSGTMVDAVLAELSAHPDEMNNPKIKSGVEKIQSGITQTVGGVINTLTIEGLDDRWRRDRAAELVVLAPRAATLVTDPQRAQLAELAGQVANQLKDEQTQAHLRAVATILGGKRT